MHVKEVLPVEDVDSTISTVTQEDDKEDGTELTEEKSTGSSHGSKREDSREDSTNNWRWTGGLKREVFL